MTDKNKDVADAVRKAATAMRLEADHLDKLAGFILERDDLGYAQEAISAICNVAQAVRLDVIVSRLVRTSERG